MLRYTRADVGFGTLRFKFRQVQVLSRSPMVALPCCDALANSNDARRTRLDVPRRWLPSRNAVAHYVARIMTSSHECIAFSGRSRRFECRQRPKLGRICRLPPVVYPPCLSLSARWFALYGGPPPFSCNLLVLSGFPFVGQNSGIYEWRPFFMEAGV